MDPGNARVPRLGAARTWTRDLLILLVAAAGARASLFSGFIGGDDFAYAHLAREIIDRGYPTVVHNVFASRPIFVAAVAATVALLGWSELAIVLPVLLASLWGIGCAYALGTCLAGRATGIVSAATLAVFPLDLVYATTTANDIVGSAILATAAACGVAAVSAHFHSRRSVALTLGFFAGVAAGLAPGAKLAFVLGWIPLGIAIALVVWSRRTWAAASATVVGWACAQIALLLFFLLTSGAMFDNYRVELGFNRTFMAEPYLAGRADALLSYPRWVFGIRPALADSDRFFPYGLFFPLAVLSLAAGLRWNRSRTWFPALWFGSIVLLLEFWPLRVVPYTPIHRLPRFMHLAAVPGALLIGLAVQVAWARRGRWRVTAGVLWTLYVVHAMASSLVAVERHRDSMQDLRFAAEMSSRFPGPIVTDAEMRGYLMFRRGFRDIGGMQQVLGAQVYVPARALVIAGGGRRIDMDPDWTERRVPAQVPDDWVKLADLPGTRRPWRRARGSVYLSGAPSRIQARGFRQTMGPGACGAGRRWTLVDVVDVGEPASEGAHRYRIHGQTFAGVRMLFSDEQAELEDNGRAFRGFHEFDVLSAVPRVDACLVKRIDPSALRQVSRWSIGDRPVGDMVAARSGGASWEQQAIVVPAEVIPKSSIRFTERFVSADVDVNAYLIEVYQLTRSP